MRRWRMVVPINVDADGVAKTVLAGYYKYGVQTLLTGNFGTTGTIVMEYEDDTIQHGDGRNEQDCQGSVL